MAADTIPGIVAALADLGVRLPLRPHSEDLHTAADATGSAVFVVDHNGERGDEDAIAIAGRLIVLVNASNKAPEHPDDLAVSRFAAAMQEKLAKKRDEGRGGWEDKAECSNARLSRLLRDHVEKGDPIDVANLAMMIHQRGERIAADTPSNPERAGWRLTGVSPEVATSLAEQAATATLAQDVIDLVIAARIVAFEDQSPEALRALDSATEAFASRVPWDEDPEALTAAMEAGR